jgi:hypothetical protein
LKLIHVLSIVLTISVLIACTPAANMENDTTSTPTATFTNIPDPTSPPKSIPPTAEPRLVNLKRGGFSFSIQPTLKFDIDGYSVNLSDPSGELSISLNRKPYIASAYTLESFLGKYVDEIAARGGTLNPGTPYQIMIDGISGLAVDLSGDFLNDPVAGKAIIISPGKDFIVFGLALYNLSTHENGWAEMGSVAFEMLIESIKFQDKVKD